ncbi:hypothetical protein [Nocardia seriolae]|uniref:DUF3291 domain-containing protein n=1 Tax=Nocardia seriolae TaxID=37332 RepID=A0ABC9YRI6_9NOCA|nr:hypothetical protein [Nocardia seriolae]BEK95240.1 hypothetical protein NSER024013_31460 [Nocardia seriolae]GAM46000.1 hypothetical protein NS07_v2contig00022-0021 [Nocardia seriolae]GAP28067.1 hypothetical protein NSK11_contig00027-0021 [Nocardia seriolae]
MHTKTFSEGTLLLPWSPGPKARQVGPVFVSVTDFLAGSQDDAREIYTAGLELGKTWPVMQGAVGLWLWGRPAEQRGGSISVWESEREMRRFGRWPVHTEIVRAWRGRVGIGVDSWNAESFDADAILTRAGDTIERPHRRAA